MIWLFCTLTIFLTVFWIVVLVVVSRLTSAPPSFSSAQITPIEAALALLVSVFVTTAIHTMVSSGNANGNDCDATISDVSKMNIEDTANSSSRHSANNTDGVLFGSIVDAPPHRGVNSMPFTSLSDSVSCCVEMSWVSIIFCSSVVVVVVAVAVANGPANKIAATKNRDNTSTVLVNEDSLSDVIYS